MALGLTGSGIAHAFEARMELNPNVLRIGEAADLAIIVQGVNQPPAPSLPSINGLRINGPGMEQSMSTSIINGRMQTERSVTFRYRIIPLQPGEFTIGPFTYAIGNEQVEIPAQRLRVAGPAGQTTAPSAPNWTDLVFATLSIDKEKVYVQENIALTLSIFSRGVNLGREVSLMNMPESGIQMQPFQELQPTREIVRGEVYDVRRYRANVRALTSGSLVFEPGLRVQLLVQRANQRDSFFQSFFSNMEANPLDLQVPPVPIDVQPLPEQNRPADFTGGVGTFAMEAKVEPRAVRVGDPITLTLVVSGQGNIDAVSAPQIRESSAFRVYPPRMTVRDMDAAQTSGRKQFEQVIIPRNAEAVEIPALSFSYFDPASEQYKTITKGPFPLELDASEATASRWVQGDNQTADGSARILGRDILYLKPAPEEWGHADDQPWYRHPLLVAAQGIPIIALIAVFFWTRRSQALKHDVALARRTRAPRRARAGLRHAERGAQAGALDSFHDGVWQALTHYFGDRLNLPPGDLSADRVCTRMAKGGLPAEAVDALRAWFERCERQRFSRGTGTAGADPSALISDLNRLRQLLKQCERVKA